MFFFVSCDKNVAELNTQSDINQSKVSDITVAQAQEKSELPDREVGFEKSQYKLSMLTRLLQYSTAQEGTITFKKIGAGIYQYTYKDDCVSIQIDSSPEQDHEFLLFYPKKPVMPFLGITPGMSEDEVRAVLGKPAGYGPMADGNTDYFYPSTGGHLLYLIFSQGKLMQISFCPDY
jgi:hypothetical protein